MDDVALIKSMPDPTQMQVTEFMDLWSRRKNLQWQTEVLVATILELLAAMSSSPCDYSSGLGDLSTRSTLDHLQECISSLSPGKGDDAKYGRCSSSFSSSQDPESIPSNSEREQEPSGEAPAAESLVTSLVPSPLQPEDTPSLRLASQTSDMRVDEQSVHGGFSSEVNESPQISDFQDSGAVAAHQDAQIFKIPSELPWADDGISLAVRGVPPRLTQFDLLRLWRPDHLYFNFLYLPYSKKQHRSTTYCFINFTSRQHAEEFVMNWSGRRLPVNSYTTELNDIGLDIKPSKRQGYQQNMLHVANDRNFQSIKVHPLVFDATGVAIDFHTALNACLQE